MPQNTATVILDGWLRSTGHAVTDSQKHIILEAFSKCSLPLFLKLCFEEALRWKSYTPEDQTILQMSVKSAINSLFERLEKLHGYLLISHTLGYMTAAKAGLSDAEIDDILSIDDDVLNDVYQYWTPPVRRIPPLLWVRGKSDLGSYVVSRGADAILVNTWYHRQFIETARERYLQPEVAKVLHRTLAEYFLGVWSGENKKAFQNKQGDTEEKQRLVSAQPNVFPKQADASEVFNYRKLNELPHHLLHAGELQMMKDCALLNFDFLLSKVRGVGLPSVIQDFKEALDIFPEEKELKLVCQCLEV